MVRLDTVMGLLEAVPVTAATAPVTQEAVYAVMSAPPLEDGAENAMLAWPLPAVAAPIVGAPGTVVVPVVVLPPPPPPQAANTQRLSAVSADWKKCFMDKIAFFGLAWPEPGTSCQKR